MNREAISAISDAIAAVGVIVTVAYLAVQIRHNTRAVGGATEQSLMTQEINLFSLVAQNAGVFQRGCADLADLDEDERELFFQLVGAYASQQYSAFVQFRRGLIPASVWASYQVDWHSFLSRPGFAEMWSEMGQSYPQEFLEEVHGVLAGR